ncbi:MAG TPA: hypothetical protein VGH81_04605 [Rudaea sp.]|jgi:hypothetical protein
MGIVKIRPSAGNLMLAGSVTAALLMLSGCQVFQPYVIPNHFNEVGGKTNQWCGSSNASVDEVAYARSIERQLSCFARQHAEFASAVGYTLIPLAALVAYQGFTQANPHNIAALSSAGFAAYGIANYQYKPRDVIYLAGVAAVDCAIQVTTPSILSPSQVADLDGRYATFSRQMQSVFEDVAAANDRLTRANDALVDARLQRASIKTSTDKKALLDALDSALDAVGTLLSADLAALASANDAVTLLPKRYVTVKATDAQVRKELASTAESIVNSVNSQIATMVPNPASLSSMLSSLKLPAAAQPAAATTPPASGAAANDKIATAASALLASKAKVKSAGNAAAAHGLAPPDPADDVLRALDSARSQMAVAELLISRANQKLAPLGASLDAITAPTGLDKLYKDCAIDVKVKVPLSIAVPKDGVTVQSGGQAVSMPITGGTGKYSPVVVNPPAKGTLTADIKQGSGNSSVLSLQAKDFAEDVNGMIVIVQDEGASAAQVPVNVKH